MKTKSEVLKEFQQLLELHYTGRTPRNYTYHVRLFLDHAKNVPVRVTNEDILAYNLHIKDRGYSFRNVAINAIKAYFKFYLHKRTKSFAVIRPRKKKSLPKNIPHEYLSGKISNTRNMKAKLILSLGYGCGLRSNEVIELRTKDIDIEQQTLMVRGKGNKERMVPFSDDLAFLLLAYIEEYNPKTFLFNGRGNDGSFRFRYSKGSILKLVKKNIGPQYNFHALRHSYATRLLNQGIDISIVSKLLGHANVKTTMIYNHVNVAQLNPNLLPV